MCVSASVFVSRPVSLHRGPSAWATFGISNLTIQRSDHFWTSHLQSREYILDPTALPAKDFLVAVPYVIPRKLTSMEVLWITSDCRSQFHVLSFQASSFMLACLVQI